MTSYNKSKIHLTCSGCLTNDDFDKDGLCRRCGKSASFAMGWTE